MKTAKVIVKLRHDNGTQKISVWSTSIENAIQTVLKTENAPRSAIIYAKAAPLTISDIKRLSAENAPYFFSRKSMQFFGQKMSDFSITRKGDSEFYICAPRPFGKTERVFNPFTGELKTV
jgi:hypothetical protein